MNESERKRLIIEFISKNEGREGTTLNQVADHMNNNSYCAKQTAKNAVNKLIPDIIIDKKIGNSFHRLFVNRQDDFIKLVAEMDNLEKVLNELNSMVVKKKGLIKNPQTQNLIHLAQLTIYRKITRLVSSIDKYIKSYDDRQVLYSKLAEVLKASTRLNEIIFPNVFNQALYILKQNSRKGISKMQALTYTEFVSKVASIITDSDLKK